MYLITLDFWSIVIYVFIAGTLLAIYQLALYLGRYCEGLIISYAQMGMHQIARALLVALIGYDGHTYQQSRFIIWNQVHIRFAILWGITFLVAGLLLLFQIPRIVWVPAVLALVIYRLVNLWMNPSRPPIHTQDPALKQLIQDVNEPRRAPQKRVGPMIRRWDYLDELFAESV